LVEALKLELDAAADAELVSRAAEGHAELQRARRLKADLLNQEAKRAAGTLPVEERVADAFVSKAAKLAAFDRYMERAHSKRRLALRKLSAPDAGNVC
jgi:hypothetical protein